MAKTRSQAKATRPQPQLAAALFCENVLEEKEGVTSLVRILDTMIPTVPAELKESKEKIGLPVLAFVAFKAGDAKGEYVLQIDMVPPSGEREKMAEATMNFLGGEAGVNVKANLVVPIQREGLYWYEVLVDGELFTRMPLRLRHAPTAPPKRSESAPKPKKRK